MLLAALALALGLAEVVSAFNGALISGLTAPVLKRDGSSEALTGDAADLSYHHPLFLVDYDTDIGYWAPAALTWNWCTQFDHATCHTNFFQTTLGGNLNFTFGYWSETDTGCYNIDFMGALGSGLGRCCTMPCNIQAPLINGTSNAIDA